MTELNDHLKLLFARAGTLFCECCGKPVRSDSAETIFEDLQRRAAAAGDPRLLLCFPVPVLRNFSETEVRELLARQGYTRIYEPPAGADAAPAPPPAQPKRQKKTATRGKSRSSKADDTPSAILQVIQDRFRLGNTERGRVLESLESALRVGQGRVIVQVVDDADPPRSIDVWRYSAGLHCPDCDRTYSAPSPSRFSFNSPIGGPVKPVAASGDVSASTMVWSFPMRTRPCARAPCVPGRASPTRNVRRTWKSMPRNVA